MDVMDASTNMKTNEENSNEESKQNVEDGDAEEGFAEGEVAERGDAERGDAEQDRGVSWTIDNRQQISVTVNFGPHLIFNF